MFSNIKNNSNMCSKKEVFNQLLDNPVFSKACINNPDFPEPFHPNINDVKAIILGADPSNAEKKVFKHVFGLENPKSPYFDPILKNLSNIDLSLDNIYVQNLCPNYFNEVTDDNDLYWEIAKEYWLPILRDELNLLFKPEIPVLVTAWKPLIVVAPDAGKYKACKSMIYSDVKIFSQNLLGRPVIALFRGGRRKGKNGFYDLTVPDFGEYANKIRSLIYNS